MPKTCPAGSEAASRLINYRVRQMRSQSGLVNQEDPDGIHDMRVASRRLRAVISEHAPYLGSKAAKRLQNETKAITQLLGTPRELDVSIALLDDELKHLQGPPRIALAHAIDRLKETRAEARTKSCGAVTLLSSDKYDRALMDAFESLAPRKACYVKEAPRRLTKRFASLCKAYEKWLKHGDQELLHEVRIAFKKLRYTCEVYEPLYEKDMKAFIKQLKKAQEHLGDWNDYRVAMLLVQETEEAANGFARLGLPIVYERITNIETRLRESFAQDAQQFFSHENRQAAQSLFDRPASECCRKNGSNGSDVHNGKRVKQAKTSKQAKKNA